MPTIKEQLINTGRVRWRFRDYPLPIHKYSRFAAHAAQCAGAQGHYFEMQDQLFVHHQWAQTGKDPASLFRDLAKAAGVDVQTYDACMEAGRYAQRIEFSRQEGDKLLVDGTPTFYANGKKLEFRRLPGSDDFKALADSILAHRPQRRGCVTARRSRSSRSSACSSRSIFGCTRSASAVRSNAAHRAPA